MSKPKKVKKSVKRTSRASDKSTAKPKGLGRKAVLPSSRHRKHARDDRAQASKSLDKRRRKPVKEAGKKASVKKVQKLPDVISKRDLDKRIRSEAARRGWIQRRLKKAEQALLIAQDRADKARAQVQEQRLSAIAQVKHERALRARERKLARQTRDLDKIKNYEQAERLAIQAETIDELKDDIEEYDDQFDIYNRLFNAEMDGRFLDEAYDLSDEYGYSVHDLYEMYWYGETG